MKINGVYGSDASGSEGTLTVARNTGGLYVKSRKAPSNPNSDLQQAIRAAMTDLSSAWPTLSQSDYQSWAAYAAAKPFQSKLGRTIFLSPRDAFQAYNLPIEYVLGVGTAQLTAPPPNAGLAGPYISAASEDTSSQACIEFQTPVDDDGTGVFLLFTTRPIPVNSQPQNNMFRLALGGYLSSIADGPGNFAVCTADGWASARASGSLCRFRLETYLLGEKCGTVGTIVTVA